MLKIFLVLLLFSINKSKTLLVVPAFATHSFTAALAVPLTLEDISIAKGLILRAFYFLPDSTADDLKFQYFQDIWINHTGDPQRDKVKFAVNSYTQYQKNHEFNKFPFTIAGKRKRDTSSGENSDESRRKLFEGTSGARWLFYDGLGKLLSLRGFEGRNCVLRGICEAAEKKFGAHGGLFGELFHILFR